MIQNLKVTKWLDRQAYWGFSVSPPDDQRDWTNGQAEELRKLFEAAPDIRTAYGKLHDILSDCIESGRLTEADIPNDYQAIVELLSGPCMDAMRKALGRTSDDAAIH